MKKMWTQIKYRLKKDRGSYVSFGIVVMFTALLLNVAFVLMLQMDEAYDKKFKKLDTSHITFYIPRGQDMAWLEDKLGAIEGVDGTEKREAVYQAEVIVKDFRGEDFSMNTVFYNYDLSRKLNKLEVKEQGEKTCDNSIYIPYYVASFGEFEVGDDIVYEINGRAYTFNVAGIVEEMQYGNYGQGLMGAYLCEDTYESFRTENEDNRVIEYNILVDENSDISKIKNEISDILNANKISKLGMSDALSTRETRTMVCNLVVLILEIFSIVLLIVSVALCKFRISNSLDEEIISMGVLKAIGYTANMIIVTIVAPYVIVTVAAVFLGIFCSYAVLPALANVLTMQSGFSFEVDVADERCFLCVFIILNVVVILFSYMSARKIRKVTAIVAMRSCGERSHKKVKQNVLIFLVSFALAILVAFASMLFYNVVIEPDNFMSTLSEEVPDIIVTSKSEDAKKLINEFKGSKDIKDVLRYSTANIEICGKEEGTVKTVTAFICEDFKRVTNDLCYKGNNPKYESEIALGSVFEGAYNIGDKIELKSGDRVCEYTVTGFVQSVNCQGNICELTSDGYERAYGKEPIASLYIYLKEATSAELFIKGHDLENLEGIVSVINSEKMQKSSKEMFSGIVYVIVIAIFVLTILILLFILYIVIKSLIVQRKQELGIYKAMGYCNMQLRLQIVQSFLPATMVAALVSSMLGMWYLPNVYNFIFEMLGAMKNNMEVSLVFLVIFALVQIVVNFVISILLTKPIKRISAYSLLRED